VAIVFSVSGRLCPLREEAATVLAEELRRRAAGQLGSEGVEGARAVADAIEQALVGARDEPIPLAGDAAEAVFHVLDGSVDLTDPALAEGLALYRAVRELHLERLRPG
jgi:hypothetical protein